MKKNKSLDNIIVDLVFILIIFFINTSYAMDQKTSRTDHNKENISVLSNSFSGVSSSVRKASVESDGVLRLPPPSAHQGGNLRALDSALSPSSIGSVESDGFLRLPPPPAHQGGNLRALGSAETFSKAPSSVKEDESYNEDSYFASASEPQALKILINGFTADLRKLITADIIDYSKPIKMSDRKDIISALQSKRDELMLDISYGEVPKFFLYTAAHFVKEDFLQSIKFPNEEELYEEPYATSLLAGKALNFDVADVPASVKSVSVNQGVATSLPVGKALNANVASVPASVKSIAIDQGVGTSLPAGKALTFDVASVPASVKSVAVDQLIATSLPVGKSLTTNIVNATASVKSVAVNQGFATSLPIGRALNFNVASVPALGKSVAVNQGVATSFSAGKALTFDIADVPASVKSVSMNQGVVASLLAGKELNTNITDATASIKLANVDKQLTAISLPAGKSLNTNVANATASLKSIAIDQSPDITNVTTSKLLDKISEMSEKNSAQLIKLEEKRKITEVQDYLLKKYTNYIIFDSLSAISNTLSLRLDLLKQMPMPMLGVAAGDKIIEKGFWLKGFNSRTQQKNRENYSGFKIRQEGIVIGADAELKDDFIAGIAYTNINSRTRFTGLSNDIEKSSMHVASIYTEHNLSPKFSLNTYWHYAEALINHQINSDLLSGRGKTSGEVFRGSVEGIYSYNFDDWIISPKLGGIFDCFSIQEFTEQTDSFDFNVPSRSGDKFSVTTGVGIKRLFSVNSINIVPTLHFNIDQVVLINHSAAATLVTFGADTPEIAVVNLATASPYKTTYNLGGYINMSNAKQVKVGVGYDYYYKKGFNNHSGYLNLSFKF